MFCGFLNTLRRLRFRHLPCRFVGDDSPASRCQSDFLTPASNSNSSLLDFTKGRLDWFSTSLVGAFSAPWALNPAGGFLLVHVAMVSRQSNRILTSVFDILTVPPMQARF